MPQLNTIKNSQKPQTITSLKRALKKAGIKPGMNIIVHSSLNSIGWVCGGAYSVIKAIMDVITWKGTIIMPTQSPSLSDPSSWKDSPVPRSWWNEIRINMPPFDCFTTQTEYMGIVPEVFRSFPEVERSYHPIHSFGIWGEKGRLWSLNQPLDESLSEFSPLGRLYENEGYILLIGVNHDSNTSLHLAETMIDGFPKQKYSSPILKLGERVWEEYEDYEYNSKDFYQIGKCFEEEYEVEKFYVGNAITKLIPMKEMVDFSKKWIEKNRDI